jgi:thiamine transport system permease protein
MAMHRKRIPPVLWLGLVPLSFLSLVMLAPLLRIGVEAVTGASGATGAMVADLWRDDYLRWRIVWSFVQAGATCIAALVLAVPVAWVLARYRFAGRGLLLRLLMLPFVVPTLVAAMGVLALWGPHGLVSGWFGTHLQDTPWLLLYGNLFFNLCLVVRAGVDALGHVSAARVAAARTLGASPWRVFWRVEWPAIVPWLASALCLVFLYCLSGFGLALVLGGQRYATAEVEIYTLVAHELQLAQAGVLTVCMALLTALVALAYAWIEQHLAIPGRPDAIALRRPASWRQWAAVGGAVLVLGVFCGAPLLAIAVRAVQAGAPAWATVLEDDSLQAVGNTLRFTAAALVLAVVLGVTHALAARRSVWLRAAAFLPFVVSPVAVAFGLLLLYPQWTASLWILVAAYALLAYPFVAQSLGAALDQLPLHLTQAARTLGATPWRLFWRVTLPLVLPSLRRGMAFAAATALGEFAVTLFLSRPEWTTLTTLIYERLGRPGAGNRDAALVLAALLMLLALLAFLLIDNPGRRDGTRTRLVAGAAHA